MNVFIINKNMNIDDILKKRKQVWKFDEKIITSQSLIDSLLRKSWKVTPSKNNFMSYSTYVIGPKHKKLKIELYDICKKNQLNMNKNNDNKKNHKLNKTLQSILTAPYNLIFTNRFEDQPNTAQLQEQLNGVYYEALDITKFEDRQTVNCIEIGMFCNTLSALCVENNLDVSYVKCFSEKVSDWKKTMPFVKASPIFVMNIGKGEIFKKPKTLNDKIIDQRPDYERIINWI